uniref:Sushi domain-containing protein n=1 Tax=Chromera velia CCMP2878 TaxID=1169474 RepID=A0A0G4HMK1_9ALVE|eukprot:Cvel_7491.t1-p1 / transcript=Cvel_7491.t1 / gene=Cvel_7491 / organism=Chromera_velia_CCMP2878 / gene_product=Complement factor H, putative / transcript_product=Complement factor H, putative / location=Cvel_scaffold393:254-23005(-) / protein_length=2427 / sequence_SO=supercontig / SO=protein_coding / is_pseudo=false
MTRWDSDSVKRSGLTLPLQDPETGTLDVPITGPPPPSHETGTNWEAAGDVAFVQTTASSSSSSSSSRKGKALEGVLFSHEKTAHCVDPILNLVEGVRLYGGAEGGHGMTTVAPETGEEGERLSPRVAGWSDPFYGSAVFVEPEEGRGPLFVDSGDTGTGNKAGAGSGVTTLDGWVTFRDGRYLESVSDCAPLLVSERSVTDGGWSLGVFVDVQSIREDERKVLFDNGAGFRVGVVGKKDGKMDFGVLPSDGSKFEARGKGVMAETCVGFPALFVITIEEKGGSDEKPSFGIWKSGAKMRSREELPETTGKDVGVNVWERLGGLGRMTLGCDVRGEECFDGRLGYFFFLREKVDDIGALTEEILSETLDVSGRCGNGQIDPGEQCDPETEGDTLCSCNCQSRCVPFEEAVGGENVRRFLKEGEGRDYGSKLLLRCNRFAGFYSESGQLDDSDEIQCGVTEPGKWTFISLSCKESCSVLQAPWLKDPEEERKYRIEEEQFMEDTAPLRHGSEVTVACREPFEASGGEGGRQKLVCVDGTMEPKTLTCGLPCKVEEENFPSGSLSERGAFANRQVGSLECKHGFTPPLHADRPSEHKSEGEEGRAARAQAEEAAGETHGHSPLAAQILSCDDGVMSRASLQCREKCAPLSRTELERSHVELLTEEELNESALGMGMEAGSFATLKCQPGSSPSTMADGRSLPDSSSLRCEGASWAALPLRCTEPCSRLPLPTEMKGEPDSHVDRQGGGTQFFGAEADVASIPFGDVVDVSCDEDAGFEVEEGVEQETETVVCLGKEKGYSPLSLLCHPVCKSGPSGIDATLYTAEGEMPPGPPYRHGATLRYKCNSGFSPSDPQIQSGSVVCSAGSWTRLDLHCLSTCPPFDVSEIHNRNAEPVGVSMDDILHNDKLRQHGAVVRLQCPSGQMGKHREAGQAVTCVNGQWEEITLQCTKTCPVFVKFPEDAYIVDGQGLSFGSTRTIMCAPSFFPAEGVEGESVTCIDGQWTISLLECGKRCGPFPPLIPEDLYDVRSEEAKLPEGALLESGNVFSAPYVPHGAWIPVRCNEENATPLAVPAQKGADTTEWVACRSGRYTSMQTSCVRRCPHPNFPQPTYAPLDIPEGVKKAHGDQIGVQCGPGYTGVPETPEAHTSLCLNGTWTEVELKCFKNCPLYRPRAQWVISGDSPTAHGSRVFLKCIEGFRNAIGASKHDPEQKAVPSECIDGVWTTPELECHALCPPYETTLNMTRYAVAPLRPPEGDLPYAVLEKEKFPRAHEAQVSVTCAKGFSTDKHPAKASLTCLDGKWEPLPLHCFRDCETPHPLPDSMQYTRDPQNPISMSLRHGDTRVVKCVMPYDVEADPTALKYKLGYGPSVGDASQRVACMDGLWTELTIDCRRTCPSFNWDKKTEEVTDDPGLRENLDRFFLPRFYHGSERHLHCRHREGETDWFSAPADVESMQTLGLAGLPVPLGSKIVVELSNEEEEGESELESDTPEDPLSNSTNTDETAKTNEAMDSGWGPREIADLKDRLKAVEALGFGAEGLEGLGSRVWPPGWGSFVSIAECSDGNYTRAEIDCRKMCTTDTFPELDREERGFRLEVEPEVRLIYPFRVHHGAAIRVRCKDGFDQSPLGLAGRENFTEESLQPLASRFDHSDRPEHYTWCFDGKWVGLPIVDCMDRCPAYNFTDGDRQLILQEPSENYWDERRGTFSHRSQMVIGCAPGMFGILPKPPALVRIEEVGAQQGKLSFEQIDQIKEELEHLGTGVERLEERGGFKDAEFAGAIQGFMLLQRNETLTCMDGHWTHQSLRCRPMCPHPPENERYEFGAPSIPEWETTEEGEKLYLPDTTIKVRCNAEKGSDKDESTTIACKGGTFTAPELDCKRSCLEVGSLFMRYDGDTTGYMISGTDTAHGTELFITCQPNYDRTSGEDPNKIVCNDGEWDGFNLVCDQECGSLREILMKTDAAALPHTSPDAPYVFPYVIHGNPDANMRQEKGSTPHAPFNATRNFLFVQPLSPEDFWPYRVETDSPEMNSGKPSPHGTEVYVSCRENRGAGDCPDPSPPMPHSELFINFNRKETFDNWTELALKLGNSTGGYKLHGGEYQIACKSKNRGERFRQGIQRQWTWGIGTKHATMCGLLGVCGMEHIKKDHASWTGISKGIVLALPIIPIVSAAMTFLFFIAYLTGMFGMGPPDGPQTECEGPRVEPDNKGDGGQNQAATNQVADMGSASLAGGAGCGEQVENVETASRNASAQKWPLVVLSVIGAALFIAAIVLWFLFPYYIWSPTVSTSVIETYGYVCRECDPTIRHVRRDLWPHGGKQYDRNNHGVYSNRDVPVPGNPNDKLRKNRMEQKLAHAPTFETKHVSYTGSKVFNNPRMLQDERMEQDSFFGASMVPEVVMKGDVRLLGLPPFRLRAPCRSLGRGQTDREREREGGREKG